MLKNKKGLILFLILILAYLLFKLPNTHFYLSDENTYFYMGKLISDRELPYRDFFFAHPPLQLFIFAAIFKLFGFNFFLLKTTAVLATIATSAFLFKSASEKFGWKAGPIAVFLFLFTQTTFYNSSINFGGELAAMFTMAGFYYLYNKNRPMAAGIFFGLSAITALYAIIPALAIFLALLLTEKRGFMKFLSGFSMPVLIATAPFLLLAAKEFITQVFLYHISKIPFTPADKLLFTKGLITKNLLLFAPAFLSLFVKDKKGLTLLALIPACYLIFTLLMLKTIFEFYYIIIFPFLAILGAYSITSLLGFRKPNLNSASFASRIPAAILIILAILALAYVAYADLMPLKSYNDAYSFKSWKNVTDYVVANSAQNDTIFGDYRITPVVALASNRKIAANLVDNNYETIYSGAVNPEELASKLKAQRVKYVLIHENAYGIQPFWSSPPIASFLKDNCGSGKPANAKLFSEHSNTYYIYSCSYSG